MGQRGVYIEPTRYQCCCSRLVYSRTATAPFVGVLLRMRVGCFCRDERVIVGHTVNVIAATTLSIWLGPHFVLVRTMEP